MKQNNSSNSGVSNNTTYTAILTTNLRDVYTASPKVLIREIEPNETIDRDHCWVTITPELDRLIPKDNRKIVTIQFNAKLYNYKNHLTKEIKQAFKKIKNITVIK